MDLFKIDVAKNILKSQFGFAIDTETIKIYIERNMINMPNESIFLIDLRKVVFDHYFARTFGILYDKIRIEKEIIDAVFQLKDYQVDDFLLGLIDHLSIPYSQDKDGNIQDFFIEKKLSVKLMIKENKITFLSQRSNESEKILEFINQKSETNFDDLYANKILTGAEISPKIEELVKQRFIYTDSSNNYYSVYKYLNQ